METIQLILPIFVLIGVGYLLRHVGLVRPAWVHALNIFVYYVSLPALILTSFWRLKWSDQEVLTLLSFQVLVLIAFVLLLWLLLSFSEMSKRRRAAFLMLSSLGNTVYMGFPLGLLVFGESGAVAVVAAGTVQLLAGIIISFFIIEATVLRSRKITGYLSDLSHNPLILSMLAGMLLSAFLPENALPFLTSTLNSLSATASPLALFALGAFMHGRFAHAHFGPSFWSSGIKLLAFPAAVFLAAKSWGLSPAATSISLLVAAMPNAATSFVLAEKYELEEPLVANSIFVSTILSAATLFLLLNFVI